MLDSLEVLLLPTLVLALCPPLLLSAAVFLSDIVTRFLLTDLGRLPGLSVKLLLISRLSRTVLTLSSPPVLSHLSSNPSHQLLLEQELLEELLLLLAIVLVVLLVMLVELLVMLVVLLVMLLVLLVTQLVLLVTLLESLE